MSTRRKIGDLVHVKYPHDDDGPDPFNAVIVESGSGPSPDDCIRGCGDPHCKEWPVVHELGPDGQPNGERQFHISECVMSNFNYVAAAAVVAGQMREMLHQTVGKFEEFDKELKKLERPHSQTNANISTKIIRFFQTFLLHEITKVVVFFALMTWSIIDNKIEIPAIGWLIVFLSFCCTNRFNRKDQFFAIVGVLTFLASTISVVSTVI